MSVPFQRSYQRRIQDRRAGHEPPGLKNLFWKVICVNFDCTTRTYFDFSQHTMFTISILFTTLTTKTYGKCEGASKQTPDVRIFYRARIAPPGFEIPGSATGYLCTAVEI